MRVSSLLLVVALLFSDCQSRADTILTSRIAFTTPVGGETFVPGTVVNLGWQYDGTIGDHLGRLHLRSGDTIVQGLPFTQISDRLLAWTVPDDVPPGEYRLSIKATDLDQLFYSATFRIAPKPNSQPLQTVNFSSPLANQQFELGSTVRLNWTYTGNIGERSATLVLYDASNRPVPGVAGRVPVNQQGYEFNIPGNLPPGEYRVFLGVSNVVEQFFSPTFKVVQTSIQPKEAVFTPSVEGVAFESPSLGDHFVSYQTVEIKWRHQLEPRMLGELVLVQNGRRVPRTELPAQSLMQNPRQKWQIPVGLVPGEYQLAMVVNNMWYYSHQFTITSPPEFVARNSFKTVIRDGARPAYEPQARATPPIPNLEKFVTSVEDISTTLNTFAENVLVPLINEGTLDKEVAGQAVALINLARSFSSDRNPYSLKSLIKSGAFSANELELLDKSLAQTQIGEQLAIASASIESALGGASQRPLFASLSYRDRSIAMTDGMNVPTMSASSSRTGFDRMLMLVTCRKIRDGINKIKLPLDNLLQLDAVFGANLEIVLAGLNVGPAGVVATTPLKSFLITYGTVKILATISQSILSAIPAYLPVTIEETYVKLPDARHSFRSPAISSMTGGSTVDAPFYVIASSESATVITPVGILGLFIAAIQPRIDKALGAKLGSELLSSVSLALASRLISGVDYALSQFSTYGQLPAIRASFLSFDFNQVQTYWTTIPKSRFRAIDINDVRVLSWRSDNPGVVMLTSDQNTRKFSIKSGNQGMAKLHVQIYQEDLIKMMLGSSLIDGRLTRRSVGADVVFNVKVRDDQSIRRPCNVIPATNAILKCNP